MRRVGTGSRLGGLVAWGATLLALPPASWADLNLQNLVCVKALVSVPKDSSLGVTRDELQDAILVRLRASLPRLQVDDACANTLYFRVGVVAKTSEEAPTLGYFGVIRLELLRTVLMLDSLTRMELTAWHETSVLSGPPGNEKAAIFGALDGLLSSFTTAYYRIRNP